MRPAAWTRLAVTLTLAASAWGDPSENLLRNPGFEDLVTGLPAAWKAFVYPAPGAHARLVEPGHGGARAAALVIATPYRREPDNNWSQHVAVPSGVRRLRLAGWIRAEGEGADPFLWLQCWQRRPARLLAEARSPALSRRNAWEFVEVFLDVPAGTDFAMVRLTLRGAGEGWFDDLTLAADTAAPVPPAALPGTAVPASTPGTASSANAGKPAVAEPEKTADMSRNVGQSPPAAPAPPHPEKVAGPEPPPSVAPAGDVPPSTSVSSPAEASKPEASAAPARPEPVPSALSGEAPPAASVPETVSRTDALEQTLETLRQENRLLLDALAALRAQHASVQRDLEALRRELDALRARAESPEAGGMPPATASPATPAPPPTPVPPLVPRGSEWDDVSASPAVAGGQG